MATYDLGKVVGDAGEKGDDGSTVWNTSTAPTYANNKYTFTISNLSGKTGLQIAVNDIIFYSTYYYIVSAVNTTTVDCSTRVSIKGSDASVTIVDNLTSTSSTSALSAKQGKVLNDNKIETSSIATSFGSTTSDSKVPSEKLVKTSLDAKQATLISGTNIKTVNNNSLLGSGNITIESGSDVDIVTSWEATLSDTKVPSEKLTKDTLDTKIAKSSTTGLVKNDGTIDTTSYSTFSGSYNDLSNKPTIPSASSTTPSADTSSGSYGSGTSYARSNHTHPKSSLYAESSHTHTKSQITDFPSLSTVATSGSYSDLSNKPSIPSSSSDLSDGSDLLKKSSTSGLVKNDGSIDTSTYLTSSALTNYVQKSNTSGLLKNDGSIDTSSYITSSAISGMLTSSDIADNLTTNDSSKVLSAKQGKVLKDLIGDAIAYINQ